MKKKYIINFEKKEIRDFLEKKNIISSGNVIFLSYRYKHELLILPIQGQFLGICLGIFKNLLTTRVHLRNVFNGEGVEFQGYIFSPNISNLTQINMSKGLYLRSKLYYLRKRVLWESTILYKSFL